MWERRLPLDAARGGLRTERWELRGAAGDLLASSDVDVRLGKPLDLLRLKGDSLDQIRSYAGFLRETARGLYGSAPPGRAIAECPCCGATTAEAVQALSVYGVSYRRCAECGHVFVREQPSPEALDRLFRESEHHAATYTDRSTIEARLDQVVGPKLEWLLEVYQKRRARAVESVLDVGAGGGHFVAACRRRNLRAEGYEISDASCRFAREVFDVELRAGDFLQARLEPGAFDVVTFWGLLEYTPEPHAFLDAAFRLLRPADGLLVLEVPRFVAISSTIQALCADRVARHLDPTSHVNCFSDAGMASLLQRTRFRPVAAWYFGMDAYELAVQIALELDVDDGLTRLARWVPALQSAFDSVELCDDLIMAAVPT